MADNNWLKDQWAGIQKMFSDRSQRVWEGKQGAKDLLGTSFDGELFREQLGLFRGELAKMGISLTPHLDNNGRTLVFDADKDGKKLSNAFKFEFSNEHGVRMVNGSAVKNVWMAYENGQGNGYNMTDSVTFELIQGVRQLSEAHARSAVRKAAKAGDLEKLSKEFARIQQNATKKIRGHGRISAQEIIQEYNGKANMASSAALARDDALFDYSAIVRAIAKNKGTKYGGKMYNSYGSDYASRERKIGGDVRYMLGALTSSRNKEQTIATLKRKFGATYGKGINAILDLITPFASLGLDVANVSNGGYAAYRASSVSNMDLGGFFGGVANVHIKQRDNYVPRTHKMSDAQWRKKYESLTKKNTFATKRTNKYAGEEEKAEERLFQYLEVSQEEFEAARAQYEQEHLQEVVAQKIKEKERKEKRSLTEEEKKQIRADAKAKVSNIVSTIDSDSYGITKQMKHLLDSSYGKSVTITNREIERYRTKKRLKGSGDWVARDKKDYLTEEEAIKRIIADKYAKDHEASYGDVYRNLSEIEKVAGSEKEYGDEKKNSAFSTMIYTYKLGRRFDFYDKILGGQGDRGTTFYAHKRILDILAKNRGLKDSSMISAVRMTRKLDPRNIDEWILPRMRSLEVSAIDSRHEKKLAGEMNKLMYEISPKLYEEKFGKFNNKTPWEGGYYSFNKEKGEFLREDLGVNQFIDEAFDDEGKRAAATAQYLLGWGKLFKTFGLTPTGLFKSDNAGGVIVDEEADKLVPLYAAFNAIGKDWYAKPSVAGGFHLDRRAEYGRRRRLAAASAYSNRDFSNSQAAFDRMMADTEMSAEEWEKRQEEFKKVASITMGTLAPTAPGAKYFDLDSWSGDDLEPAQWVGGRLLAEDFKNTSLGRVYQDYLQYKKDHGNDGSGYQALLKMPAKFGIVNKGVRHENDVVAIPTSLLEDIKEETEDGIGYISGISAEFGLLNRLLNHGGENALDAATGAWDAQDRYDELVAAILETMDQNIYDKDGSIFRAAHRSRVKRGGFIPARKYGFKNKEDLVKALGPDKADFAEELITNSGLINRKLVENMYAGGIQGVGANDEAYDKMIHLRTREFGDIFKNLSDEERKKLLSDYVYTGDDDQKLTKKAIFKRLSKLNLRGVDIDDKLFQGLTGGLQMLLGRGPFTEGMDQADLPVYVTSRLKGGFLPHGAGWGMNLDFDGDQFMAMLALNESAILGKSKEEIDDLYENNKVLQQFQKRRQSISDFIWKETQSAPAKERGLSAEKIRFMSDVAKNEAASWSGKYGFTKTGQLDNYREKLSTNLSGALLDELAYNNPETDSAGKAINAVIARHVFEAISQDAISSKKVTDRYQKEFGAKSEAQAYQMFYDDLEKMLVSLSENKTFVGPDSSKTFIADLVRKGIMGEGDVFDDRITGKLMESILPTTAGRKAFYNQFIASMNQGKKYDDLTEKQQALFDAEKTSDRQFYGFLRKFSQNKEGTRFAFTEAMASSALDMANTYLEEVVKANKATFSMVGPGNALGAAVANSRLMYGKEGINPFNFSEQKDKYGAAGSNDPMTNAANTLLKAAEALLKFAGGAGGKGGGGAYSPVDDDQYIPAYKFHAGTTVARMLRPSSYAKKDELSGIADTFVESLEQNRGKKNLGYDNTASMKKGFDTWFATIRGTMVGDLTEMLLDASSYGLGKDFFTNKSGQLLPAKKMKEKLNAWAGEDEGRKNWVESLLAKGSSGTDKSFLQQYISFEDRLRAVGYSNLKKMGRPTQGEILENVREGALKQLEIQNSLSDALRVYGYDEEGKRIEEKVKSSELLGTEAEIRTAINNSFGYKGFLDTLYVDTTEGGMKALRTADLKRLYKGMPKEEQMLQMVVYSRILDNITKKINQAWDEGGSDEAAFELFKNTREGESLGWDLEKFKKTKGVRSDGRYGLAGTAQVMMSIIDEDNKASAAYFSAYGGYREYLQNLIDDAVAGRAPLTDESMQVLKGAFNASVGDKFVHLGEENNNALAINTTKWGLAKEQQLRNQAEQDNVRMRLSKGLYDDEAEKAKLEARLDKLTQKYEKLTASLKEYHDTLVAVVGSEEEATKVEEGLLDNKGEDGKSLREKIQESSDVVNKAENLSVGSRMAKGYKSLVDQYNKMAVSYNADKIAKNKTVSPLEKEALDIRMKETEEQMEDLKPLLKQRRELLNELGLGGEADDIEAQGGKKYKLGMATVGVKNKGITSLWDSLSVGFKNMMQRFTQMGLAYSILNKLKQGLAQVVQNAKQLDKVMTNLRIVTGYSREDARGLIASYADLATQLSSTTAEVATSAQEWLRQGYQVTEVNKLVTSSIQLSVLGMMSASDATKALTSAMKGFKMEASEVNDIVDKFTTLDMSAATTAGDIATALSQFAATAQMSGVSIDQAAAMATTIMDVSQKDAGATGNAIKTMLSRFGNVKAGTFAGMAEGDSDETTDKINDIERVLNTLGIQVRSSAREMRDFDDVLADIAAKWDHLDKVSQNAIATALAGTRQRESFAVLMNNYEKYQEFLEISQNSEGTAEEKYASYVESLEASQKRIQAAWEDFANNSGMAEFLTNVNNLVSGFVKNWLPSIFKWLTKIFVLLNSYKLPVFLKAFLSPGGRGGSFLSGMTSEGYSEKVRKAWAKPEDYLSGFGGKLAYNSKEKAEEAKKAAENAAVANAANQATTALNETADAANKKADAERKDTDATTQHMEAVKEDKNATKDHAQQTKDQGNAPGNPDAPANDGKQPKGNKRRLRKTGLSKANMTMVATGVAMDLIAGATSKQQGMNWSNMGGGLQEASGTANRWATANSTISNIGYAWGPLVGMITTTLADALNKFLIIPLIDREANERKMRVEQANKLYSQINGIGGAISELVGYAKQEYLSAEDSAEMTEKLYSLLTDYYKTDSEAQQSVEKYLIPYLNAQLGEGASVATLYDVAKLFEEGTKEQREIIVRALQYAQQGAALEQKQDAQEEELVNNQKKVADAVNAFTRYVTLSANVKDDEYARQYWLEHRGELLGMSGGSISARDVLAVLERDRGTLDPEEQEFYVKFSEMYDSVSKIAAAEQTALDIYNKQLISNAILITEVQKIDKDSGKLVSDGTLLSKNLDELKNLGSDEIIRLIGEQVYKSGGLNGESLYINDDRTNGFTEKAISLISQAIKADPTLSAIVSHSAYSISDLVYGDWSKRQKERGEISEDFATALHMTVQEFEDALENGSLARDFGNITLGDLLKTPEEIRSSMEGLSSIFQSLSNNTFLTAENLENIINKYPTLIKYLGDNNGLMSALVSNIGELARVYTSKIYDQLVSNTELARQFKDDLYRSGEYDTEALRAAIGGAENLKQIIDTLELGPEKIGLSPDDFSRLVEQIKGMFDNIDVGAIFKRQIATDTFIPYLDMKLDRQLESLNKQKEALQQINKQREYENKLIEARNKLEEASKEKKRIWREGVGWVYEADQNALAEAQKNLEEVENERQVRELDIMIDQVNATKELIKTMQDDAKFKALEDAMNAMLGESAGDYGINGLIAITKGLYNGDDSIGKMLPGIGEELSELTDKISDLIDKEFTPSYNSSTELGALIDRANDSSVPEAREEAEKELGRRGFTRDDHGGWKFSTPQKVDADSVKAAQDAYGVASNKEEIAEWLGKANYTYDESSKTWVSPLNIFKTRDKGKNTFETWIKSDHALDEGTPFYKHIESDFLTNAAAVFREDENGIYQHAGDIDPAESFDDFLTWRRNNPGTIIDAWYGDREFAYVGGDGTLYALKKKSETAAAHGSLGLPGGPALINELGTEAIVTPYGTVTSLPSGTGVVPADITKNLWELGEVAPSIAQLLNPVLRKGDLGALGDSFNVQNMVVNMNPNESFDVDRFVTELKSAVALRKNS